MIGRFLGITAFNVFIDGNLGNVVSRAHVSETFSACEVSNVLVVGLHIYLITKALFSGKSTRRYAFVTSQ